MKIEPSQTKINKNRPGHTLWPKMRKDVRVRSDTHWMGQWGIEESGWRGGRGRNMSRRSSLIAVWSLRVKPNRFYWREEGNCLAFHSINLTHICKYKVWVYVQRMHSLVKKIFKLWVTLFFYMLSLCLPLYFFVCASKPIKWKKFKR